ncbi:MAG TPA: hypothetical protein VD994_06220, partial [Prosthecobacter sp.]|nr:hypothetical protein [Prosthecobacter sp.]
MNPLSKTALLLPLAAVLFASCATIKRITPDRIPLPPLPKFSQLKKITRIIPGLPGSDKAAEDDPTMPFNARGTLGYGHTIRIDI